MAGARHRAMIAPLLAIALSVACNALVGYDDFTKAQPPGDGTSSGGTGGGGSSGGDDDDIVDVDDAGPDAPPAKPRCDPLQPFGQPEPLPLDATLETKKAIMTRDEREIFYVRGASSPFVLRHATRPTRDAKWDGVEPVTETLTPSPTELGSIVLNAQKLYFWVVDLSGSSLTSNPYVATRNSGGGFAPGIKLGGATDRPIFVMETDDSVYWSLSAVVDGAGNQLIHHGNVQGSSIIGDDIVPNLHEYPSLDDHPVLPKSELVVYFASTRTGTGAQGSSDIWRAERKSRSESFGSAVNVTELNTSTLDVPSWVSDDDCVILLDRSRHIYVAQRPAP